MSHLQLFPVAVAGIRTYNIVLNVGVVLYIWLSIALLLNTYYDHQIYCIFVKIQNTADNDKGRALV